MNDEQIKNAIEAIKSRLPSASLAEFPNLSSAVVGLLSYTNSPEMEDLVKKLQADLKQRVQESG